MIALLCCAEPGAPITPASYPAAIVYDEAELLARLRATALVADGPPPLTVIEADLDHFERTLTKSLGRGPQVGDIVVALGNDGCPSAVRFKVRGGWDTLAVDEARVALARLLCIRDNMLTSFAIETVTTEPEPE